MENKQEKKPAEWFKMLKEPYRSEAIANIKHHDRLSERLHDSLCHAFHWKTSIQGLDYWHIIYNSIEAGETTYLEPEQIGNTDNLKPEPIELRPEELVSGEVYKNVFKDYTYIFQHQKTDKFIHYYKMLNFKFNFYYNDKMCFDGIFYHATPEEK